MDGCLCVCLCVCVFPCVCAALVQRKNSAVNPLKNDRKKKEECGLMGKRVKSIPPKTGCGSPEMFLKYPSTICALCYTEIAHLNENGGNLSDSLIWGGLFIVCVLHECVCESCSDSVRGIKRSIGGEKERQPLFLKKKVVGLFQRWWKQQRCSYVCVWVTKRNRAEKG